MKYVYAVLAFLFTNAHEATDKVADTVEKSVDTIISDLNSLVHQLLDHAEVQSKAGAEKLVESAALAAEAAAHNAEVIKAKAVADKVQALISA